MNDFVNKTKVIWMLFNCSVSVGGPVWIKGLWSFFILCPSLTMTLI